ncbi:MAG: hypothetical protein ACJ8CH_02365 [Microvirga sp.]
MRLATSIRFERRQRGGYAVFSRRGERMQARFAVVAIGRGARSTGLPSARRYLDDHVAIVARFGRVGNPAETRTVVEAVPGGWFYMAALPRGRMVAVFMTRAATARGGRDSRRRVWLEAMSHTALIRSSLPDLHLMEALSVHDARASYALCRAGDDWCAVGDARFAPDPLSGLGILWAIEDGVWTAEALSRGAAGLRAAAEERAARQMTEYRAGHALAYGTERRFPDDPYWVHVSRAAALNGEEAVAKAFG